MAKRYLKGLLTASVLLMTGCGNMAAVYHITLGNFYFFNNRLQEANYQYLLSWENEKYHDIVVYNLGTVYFHLGESAAAMEMWSRYTPGDRDALNYRFYYNRSLLKCETGDYRGAFADMKEALDINPRSREAKNNMEVILDRMISGPEESKAKDAESASSPKEISAASQRIFDYVKRSEVFEWETEDSRIDGDLRDW